ncbi:MAG: type II secretion system F family protein [Erysipelotrichaceae bacterium]
MDKYKYSARQLDGTVKTGETTAPSYSEFLTKLKEENLYCISYEVSQEEETEAAKSTFKVKGKNLVMFSRQLSTMLGAGVSIVKSIDILHEKTTDKKLKNSMRLLYESLQQGKALSAAMSEQSGSYPNLLVMMVKSGEISGTLDTTLEKMANHYESENKLMNKVRNAMIYPIVLCVVMVVVVTLLLAFVMPTFFELFAGQELPLPTRMLVAMSNFITSKWYVILIIVAVAAAVIPMALKQPAIRLKFDKFKIKAPLFGKLNKTIQSARFARTFATLYFSGVNIIEILEMSSDILNNTYLAQGFKKVIAKVSNGELISTSIANEDMFDSMLTSMIFIGEESGLLDSILEKTADFYDEESDTATQSMVALMEPIIIVALGVVVGFIVISIILPLYGSMKQVGQ